MFKRSLENNLKELFQFKKTTFDAPSDKFEQDTLFIEINDVKPRITQGKAIAKVVGTLIVFSRANRFPYGLINKRIGQMDPELSKKLFFYDIDVDVATSPARLQNIHERRTSFVYLYSDQYDPNQGDMTSLVIDQATFES